MYDHYIAIDWAQANMAIARLPKKNNLPSIVEGRSDISDLKAYLKNLRGKKILTFEETTGSLWLNTELSPYVDKVVVCDPTRNRFLSEGAKTDKIDAIKLVTLLKNDLLKEVYQPSSDFANLRQLVSHYEDVVKAGVRVKNQYSAIKRAKIQFEDTAFSIKDDISKIIESYELRKNQLEKVFESYKNHFPQIDYIQAIPGIGIINSTKIVARVVDAGRFPSYGHFLSYCGLVKLDRISGGKRYKQKNSRYCRSLKAAFKTAALSAIGSNNSFAKYYNYLIEEKGVSTFNARHMVARKIAIVALRTLKENKKYAEKNRNLWA